jgi:murein DD-endopeptidase MepM/ murein hydrolase activator NlpD
MIFDNKKLTAEAKEERKKSYNTPYLIVCITVSMFFLSTQKTLATQPEGNTPSKTISKTVVGSHTGEDLKIEKPEPLLVAESTPIHREIKLIDSLTFEQELLNEEILFPADDLYQAIWNTTSVNPYDSLVMPDSILIDVTNVVMPVDDQAIRITSPFGLRRRRMHKGIDLKVLVGDTIRAVWNGKVRVQRFEKRGYGNFLILRHPNGLETVYGHLSAFLVKQDQVVRAGDPIALGGNTGRSTGSHLHFETRFFGEAINPADVFDFQNKVVHEDVYVFRKKKPSGKYTANGRDKIVYHRVKPGDTLSSIAVKYGLTLRQLCKLNQITTKTKIQAGKTLRCS